MDSKHDGETTSLMAEAVKKLQPVGPIKHQRDPVHDPVSCVTFIRAYWEACKESKLDPDCKIVAAVKNPFNQTFVLELEAKKSFVIKADPVPNEQISVLSRVLTGKFANAFKALHFQHNNIDDKTVQDISSILMRSNSILELDLNGNMIGRTGCNNIIQTLKSIQGGFLRYLSLRDNPIGDEALLNLAAFVKLNPRLEILDLGNVGAGEKALVHLANALESNNTLTKLNIDRPRRADKYDEETTIHLAKAFRRNSTIKHLSMAKHRMRTLGTMWLTEYIQNWNKGITHLDLSSNEIPADGAKFIAKALSNSGCKLRELRLRANRLTNEGCQALAKSLKINTSLEVLDLAYTGLSDAGLVALCDAVSQNVNLKVLLLEGNKFGLKSKKEWQNLLGGWPVKSSLKTRTHFLDVDKLDFIPLIAPM